MVDNAEIIACGVTAGDAIRLKQGASQWWDSPEAKRPRQPSPDQDLRNQRTAENEVQRRIRFEKWFVEGGSTSVFGPGMIPGDNPFAHEYVWWYYNDSFNELMCVPDGLVPEIDPEYIPAEERDDFY